MAQQKYTIGVYDDDITLMAAVDTLNERRIKIADVFTPFPIHGLEHKLHLKESRLPVAAFWFGFLGTTSALAMMIFMNVFDWPMDIGGKPGFAYPAFVPITFELTVLLSALGMVGVYLFINKLAPGAKPVLADIRQTDDRFVIVVSSAADDAGAANIRKALTDSGALDVRETELALNN